MAPFTLAEERYNAIQDIKQLLADLGHENIEDEVEEDPYTDFYHITSNKICITVGNFYWSDTNSLFDFITIEKDGCDLAEYDIKKNNIFRKEIMLIIKNLLASINDKIS